MHLRQIAPVLRIIVPEIFRDSRIVENDVFRRFALVGISGDRQEVGKHRFQRFVDIHALASLNSEHSSV